MQKYNSSESATAEAGDPDSVVEELKKQLKEARDAENNDAFFKALERVGELNEPYALFLHVVEYANKLVTQSYMNKDFTLGKKVLEVYSSVFPVSDGELVSRPRQIMASNCVVLTTFSGMDPTIEKLVFGKLVPSEVSHAPLAFNLACYHAHKQNRTEVLKWTELALVLGKVPADFLNDTDFEPYKEDPEFNKLLDPADIQAMEEKLVGGAEFSKEILHEIIAQWFKVKYDKKEYRSRLVEVIRKHGNEKAKELVKGKYDFVHEGAFFRYGAEQGDTNLRLQMFRALGERIHINNSRVRTLPDELARFQEIESITLNDAFMKAFPPAILKLKNLKSFNFYASKIPELPPELGELTKLTNISMQRNRLKTLPTEIGNLRELHELDLENNVLEDVPEELCDLPNLRRVNFSKNKSIPGAALNNIFEDFCKFEIQIELRKVLLNLVLDKMERAQELATLDHLVSALNSRVGIVRTNAMRCIEERSDAADAQLKKNHSVALLGKLNTSAKAWKARLRQNGYRPVNTFAPNVNVLVLGEKPGDLHLDDYEGQVLTETMLKKIIDEVDTPFLQDADRTSPTASANLGELLASKDPANQRIALEMMKSGGVPKDQIMALFCTAFLAEDSKTRKQAMTLLKAHASPEMSRKLATRVSFLNVTEDKMSQTLENFGELDEIDAVELALIMYARTDCGIKYIFRHGTKEMVRDIIAKRIDNSTLKIIYRDLETLPEVLGEFSQLKELNLHANKLTEFPAELCALKNLEHLDLSRNKISTIPDEIGNLTRLKYLFVSGNKIRKLPEALTTLTELEIFRCSGNKLKSFPKGLSALKKLKQLDLQGMNLKMMPKEICEMTQLTQLSLYGNQLTDLPADLAKLTNLIQLELQRNAFETIPPVVFELTHLEKLELTFNRLKTIPEDISKLTRLKELHIRANHTIRGITLKELQALIPHCHIEQNFG